MPQASAVPIGAGTSEVPLTVQQRWLWNFIQQNPSWNCIVDYVFRLRGKLNIDALERSFATIVSRHSAFRCRFADRGSGPVQFIDESERYRLRRVSLAELEPEEAERSARNFVSALYEQRIDLAVGPLLNVTLLQLSDREYWLVFAVHRLVADCAAVDHALHEVWTLLESFSLKHVFPLAQETKQYSDYALWQQRTEKEWLQRHGAYWKERTSSMKRLQWPVDLTTTSALRGELGRMNNLFGAELSAGLRELAKREKTLLANVMLTIYTALLCRWCHQREFVVPFMIAGRQAEQRSVVGYFSHVLYLRMQLSGIERFSELLKHVSNEFFRALMHQDFGRMATRAPELLTGTFFQWITWQLDDPAGLPAQSVQEALELSVERVAVRDFGEGLTAIPPGMVDVELTVFDTSNGIYASGVYRADLYSVETMGHFMSDLRAIAEQYVESPTVPLDELHLTRESVT